MGHIIRLIVKDRATKDTYKTPEHNDNKKKDDYHRELKEELKKQLSKKIKDIYGHNGDFEVDNGEIIYVSQKVDEETGQKREKVYRTRLPTDGYFEKVEFFILWTTYQYSKENKVDISIHLSFIDENCFQIIIE